MLRITIQPKSTATVLVLEGRLSGEWVNELRRVCRATPKSPGGNTLVVSLTDVSIIDDEGRRLLIELHSDGVELFGTGVATRALIEDIRRAAAVDGLEGSAPLKRL